MGFYVKNVRNFIIFLAIVFIIFLIYNFMPVYSCKNVNRKSEWYVNDIYMSNQYYYDNLLNEEEKKAYKVLFDNIKKIETEFKIETSGVSFSKVWNALICDHPEFINLSTYSYRNYTGYIEVYPKYLTKSKIKLRSMERKVRKKIGKIVREYSKKSDFEKEVAVYEYLGHNNAYGQTYNNSDQSAYTVFSLSNTVCSGYGKAAQILFGNLNVDSLIALNSNHLFNIVNLEDEYYYFDATCSGVMFSIYDVYKNISYMGVNQNDKTSNYQMIYSNILPKVNGEKYNYYDYNGLTLTYSENNLSEIKKIIDECEYDTLEIKFTNFSEAKSGLSRNLNRLGLKYISDCNSGYCKGNGVIFLKKK